MKFSEGTVRYGGVELSNGEVTYASRCTAMVRLGSVASVVCSNAMVKHLSVMPCEVLYSKGFVTCGWAWCRKGGVMHSIVPRGFCTAMSCYVQQRFCAVRYSFATRDLANRQ